MKYFIPCVAFFLSCAMVLGGEQKKAQATVKPVAPSAEEIAAELAKESDAQKKLRAELTELNATGQKIYFNANSDGVHRLYAMNPDGSDVKCLTPAPHPGGQHPYVSTDGSKITYCGPASKELIAKLIPPGDKEREIKEDTAVVNVMALAGGDPEPIVVGNVPRFSPDGKKLVYFYHLQGKGRRAAIYDLENKKEHPVVKQGIGPGLHYSIISHDGKYLYINGKDGALVELNAEGTGPAENAKFLSQAFKIGCNMEWSRDMKWLTWVVDTAGDTGGWLMYAPFDPNRAVRPIKMPLGWAANSVNYYPDFSPCGKYYIYAHAEPEKGVKSWALGAKQELYVTRFPKCEATVRVTWNGAANMHPQWWGASPPAAANEN